jgi:hypothetical protein
MKRLFVLAAFLGGFALACSSSSDNQDPTEEPVDQSSEQDLKKKGHHCIINGIFICPKGEKFDTTVCHCK